MLEQILDYIHNYFEKEIIKGSFVVRDGNIDVDFLQQGQYFRVRGSVFNDGVHKYPAQDLVDEVFSGEVWAMAVPPQVVAISEEVTNWMDKYGDSVMSPFSSESFGGYSYSKSQGNPNSSSGAGYSWQSAFGSRLNNWRKIS